MNDETEQRVIPNIGDTIVIGDIIWEATEVNYSSGSITLKMIGDIYGA
jgi:hypothetical protein